MLAFLAEGIFMKIKGKIACTVAAFVLLSVGSLAVANSGSIYDLLDRVNTLIDDQDLRDLPEGDRRSIRQDLRSVIRTMNNPTPSLLCVVSSTHNNYRRLYYLGQEIGGNLNRSECESLAQASRLNAVCSKSLVRSSYYSLYSLRTGDVIGSYGSKTNCLRFLEVARNGLVCAGSTSHRSYFQIYQLSSRGAVGCNTMSASRCNSLIENSTRDYVCAVSTNHASYYSIYETRTRNRIGGDMASLSECLRTIQP